MEVDTADLQRGGQDCRPGGRQHPVDGKVVDGSGSVDESALTGESMPVSKKPGDRSPGATVLKTGYLVFEATEVGEDTTLSQNHPSDGRGRFDQGPDCTDGGQDQRRVCTGCHLNRSDCLHHLDACRSGNPRCAQCGNFGTGHLLPLCARACNTRPLLWSAPESAPKTAF